MAVRACCDSCPVALGRADVVFSSHKSKEGGFQRPECDQGDRRIEDECDNNLSI